MGHSLVIKRRKLYDIAPKVYDHRFNPINPEVDLKCRNSMIEFRSFNWLFKPLRVYSCNFMITVNPTV